MYARPAVVYVTTEPDGDRASNARRESRAIRTSSPRVSLAKSCRLGLANSLTSATPTQTTSWLSTVSRRSSSFASPTALLRKISSSLRVASKIGEQLSHPNPALVSAHLFASHLYSVLTSSLPPIKEANSMASASTANQPGPTASLSGSSHDRKPLSSDVRYSEQSTLGHAASTASEMIQGRREEHAGQRNGDQAAEDAGRRKREGAGRRI